MKVRQILISKKCSNLLPPLPIQSNREKTNFEYTKNNKNKSSINYSNNSYSTLFTCLVGPIVLCILNINWHLYPRAFLNTILVFVPDIIIDNPLVFLYLTIVNYITIYIAYLSLWKNKTFLKKIFLKYRILKRKNLPTIKITFLLGKLLITILKKRIFFKLKFLKENSFTLVIIILLIIIIGNIFRQPLFFLLGKNIFDNIYLYIYVMLSGLLPSTYIINIFLNKFKTNNWDFSFRLINLKEYITFFSVSLFVGSLYISYFYIWPLLGLALVYSITLKNYFFNYNLLTLNIRNARHAAMILPGLSVAQVFEHYGTPTFSRNDVIPAIENNEPTLKNNEQENFTKYSANKWISKLASTNNIKDNAKFCSNNINVPYIPLNLFKSFWDNFDISHYIRDFDNYDINITKDLGVNIAQFYLKQQENFYSIMGGPFGGRSALIKPPAELQTTFIGSKHCTVVARTGNTTSIAEAIGQIKQYAAFQLHPRMANNSSPFLVLFHGKYVSFAEYRPGFHDTDYPLKQGRLFRRQYNFSQLHFVGELTPNFSGIIGLVATTIGIEALLQENVYRPRLAFYDFTNERNAFAIHILFKYLSMNTALPTRDINLVQADSDINIFVAGGPEWSIVDDNVNIVLQKDGKLIRGT